jgi:hypothetical protein
MRGSLASVTSHQSTPIAANAATNDLARLNLGYQPCRSRLLPRTRSFGPRTRPVCPELAISVSSLYAMELLAQTHTVL